MQPIFRAIKKIKFLDRCQKNILNSSDMGRPEFCRFCGVEKKVFLNPLAEDMVKNQKSVEVLDCECERRFRHLKDFLEANFEWLEYPRSVPKLVPDRGGESNYHRERQANFVKKVKFEFDEMVKLKKLTM
jgi:hypothetical protein